jgi:hypothetical protein
MARSLQSDQTLPVQVADFSTVTAIFQHFSRVFTPFLSHKGLVSRRLWNNHGLIESREKEKNASKDKSTANEHE